MSMVRGWPGVGRGCAAEPQPRESTDQATGVAQAAWLQESMAMSVRRLLGAALALVVSLGAALAQERPIEFIKVAEVNRLLQQGAKVLFVDVRSRQEYLIRHIKGAISAPLSALDERERDIPRDGLVVLY
jgi:hypothetical protein